ncbi:hypothetical protein ACGF7U_11405 [Micromonospora sp. NPDC047670]|uniref:hypothetical protein n=1 Tax=Micromonospora sp. NPDC047670 TaxID=3364252 RepID=UPI003717D0A8
MKAHRTDIVSFAFGLIFVGLAAWWLLAQLLGLALPPVGWFLAGALIVIGILGLVGALRSGRSAAGKNATPAGDEPAAAAPAGDEADRYAAGADPTAWDPDRAAPPDDPATWGAGQPDWGQPSDRGGRSEWEVSAPMSGGPTAGSRLGDEADEWPTEAVTDVRADAVEDRAAEEDDRPRPTSGPPAGEERRRG